MNNALPNTVAIHYADPPHTVWRQQLGNQQMSTVRSRSSHAKAPRTERDARKKTPSLCIPQRRVEGGRWPGPSVERDGGRCYRGPRSLTAGPKSTGNRGLEVAGTTVAWGCLPTTDYERLAGLVRWRGSFLKAGKARFVGRWHAQSLRWAWWLGASGCAPTPFPDWRACHPGRVNFVHVSQDRTSPGQRQR